MQYNPARLENHSGFLWPEHLLSSNSNFLTKVFQCLYDPRNAEAHVRKDCISSQKTNTPPKKKRQSSLSPQSTAFASNFMHGFFAVRLNICTYFLSHNFAVLAETWIFNLCSELNFSLGCDLMALESHTEMRVTRAPLPFGLDLVVICWGLWYQPLTTSALKRKEKEIKETGCKKANRSERRNGEDLTRGRWKLAEASWRTGRNISLTFTSRKSWIE